MNTVIKSKNKIPYLRTENLKNHTLVRGTYLYGQYMGVPPPPPQGDLIKRFKLEIDQRICCRELDRNKAAYDDTLNGCSHPTHLCQLSQIIWEPLAYKPNLPLCCTGQIKQIKAHKMHLSDILWLILGIFGENLLIFVNQEILCFYGQKR